MRKQPTFRESGDVSKCRLFSRAKSDCFSSGLFSSLLRKVDNQAVLYKHQWNTKWQGHPTAIFGKYLFGRWFGTYNFRNICCKISCLPASRRVFEHLKNGIITHFKRIFTLKRPPRIFGSLFMSEIFQKVSFDPYNFRNTRLSARKSKQMKSF